MNSADINVLVYAAFASSPRHAAAREVLTLLRSSGEGFALLPAVASGFVRIVTDKRIWPEPMTSEAALAFLEAVTRVEPDPVLTPGPRHMGIFQDLVLQHGLRGPDVTDAYLAACAIERGVTWVSYDRGFARFRGLRWVNPADAA